MDVAQLQGMEKHGEDQRPQAERHVGGDKPSSFASYRCIPCFPPSLPFSNENPIQPKDMPSPSLFEREQIFQIGFSNPFMRLHSPHPLEYLELRHPLSGSEITSSQGQSESTEVC
jgi:hypothetical protein